MEIPKPRHSIEDKKELRSLYVERYYGPPPNITSSDYPGLYYRCACCNVHALSNTEFTHFARPVSFIFICENNFMTAVQVKFRWMSFKHEVIHLWSCTEQLFQEMIDDIKKDIDFINNV